MSVDRYQNAACPKCKGGCSLCAGTGRVLQGVADAYNREEARVTVRVERPTVSLKDAMRTSGVPQVIAEANAMRNAAWGYIALGISLVILLIVTVIRECR